MPANLHDTLCIDAMGNTAEMITSVHSAIAGVMDKARKSHLTEWKNTVMENVHQAITWVTRN